MNTFCDHYHNVKNLCITSPSDINKIKNNKKYIITVDIEEKIFNFNDFFKSMDYSNIIGIFFNNFNFGLDGVDFHSNMIQIMDMGSNFNQPIKNIKFPPKLISLRFGHKFNQSLDKVIFPTYLEELDLGGYDRPMDNVCLPHSIKELNFGFNFNQPLQNFTFPPNIEEIVFNLVYDQSLEDVIFPRSIKQIYLPLYYSKNNYEKLKNTIHGIPRHTNLNFIKQKNV